MQDYPEYSVMIVVMHSADCLQVTADIPDSEDDASYNQHHVELMEIDF